MYETKRKPPVEAKKQAEEPKAEEVKTETPDAETPKAEAPKPEEFSSARGEAQSPQETKEESKPEQEPAQKNQNPTVTQQVEQASAPSPAAAPKKRISYERLCNHLLFDVAKKAPTDNTSYMIRSDYFFTFQATVNDVHYTVTNEDLSAWNTDISRLFTMATKNCRNFHPCEPIKQAHLKGYVYRGERAAAQAIVSGEIRRIAEIIGGDYILFIQSNTNCYLYPISEMASEKAYLPLYVNLPLFASLVLTGTENAGVLVCKADGSIVSVQQYVDNMPQK